ncbi:DC-STAMP-like protein domain-containing protein [Phthorimaea operculella]|nr:DC-STAMP-like protein domain-containing protein [Phthorimaea operculella]
MEGTNDRKIPIEIREGKTKFYKNNKRTKYTDTDQNFVPKLSISLIHATIMSSIIGVLLTLGLAFSYRIRCLVFLLIPQFFSRVGRYTLTCYALVLILTGPATNTLKNSEVLSESLACAQEQIKRSAYQINQSIKRPYNSLKDSISMIAAGIKQLAAKIKMMTLNLSRLTLSIAHSLQSSYSWLNTVVDSCNRHLGTPYDHCSQTVQQSVADCQAVLGSWSSWLCDTAKLMQLACQPVKPLPEFCHVLEYANGNILDVVKKHLNTFIERVNSMLYLEIHVHHSYSFSNNATNSANQVAAGIVTEIRNKADMMLTWLSWSSCVTSLSLLLIIFRAKYYQNMYETRSRFDNRYITKELIDLDLKRLRHGKETVLPLNKREESKYIKTSSFRLVSSERVHLSRSAVTMVITTFKLLIHMVADYSLYWVLMTIRHHGLRQTPLKPGSPNAGIHVSGSTLISKILASLVETITLPLATPPPSIMTCLPNPRTPDFHRYLQIGILIFLLWFFALFEPYGLRLRHIIMGLYRPERAKARAVWLLNHIQRTRGSFLKFARRKLHREFKYSTERRHTFQRWLQDHIPCDLLKRFLGIYPDDFHCVLCGVIEECNECDGSHVSCETPGCPGVYCTKCYSDVGHLCTICLSPADYGDLSDVSLVKDSSEESDDEEFKCCKYFGRRKKTTVRSDEDMYDMFDYDNINYNQKVSRIIKKTETAKDSLTKLRKECKYKYEIGLNQSKNEDSYPSFERCENINLLRIKKPKNKSKKEAMLPKKRSILKKSSDKKKVKSNKEVTYEDFEEICKMDAAVEVHPFVADNFCQYMPIQDETTQAIVLKDQSQCMSQHSECMIKDFLKTLARRFFAFGVEEDEAIESKTQNNATQHTYSVRNVAIYSRQHAKRKLHKEASTIHFNALKAEVDGETMTIQNHTQSTAAQCYIFSPILYTDSCVAQDLVKDFNLGDVPVFDTLQKRKFDKTKYEDNEHTDKEHNIPEQPHKYLKQINQQLSVDEILPELKSPGRQPEKHTQYLKQINQKMAVDEILPEFKPTEPLPLKQKPFKYMKQISQKPAVHDILPEFSPPELVGPENTWNYSREGIEHKPHPQHLTTDTSSSLDVFQSLSSLLRTDSRNFLDSCSDDDESEEVDDDKTTDTTVYTMTNLEYGSPRRNKLEKLRQSVVTKSNMATATETTKSCDIGTVTSDWWSPMLERKRLTLAKKGVQVLAEDQKILQDRCVGTSARVVTFNSVARIIPSLRTHLNLMSPSRYLLESQRYYNELFLVNYPLESGYDEQYFAESRFSSHRCHVLKRKGYNEKRSEESYIKLYNPFAETWPAKTVQRNPWVTANRGKKRYPATRYKGGWRTKGVTKTKYTTRLGVRKPEIKVKSGEVCLLARPYLSTDSISLDNHHHSLTETGNF